MDSSSKPTLTIDPALDPPPLRLALVWAEGLPGCPPRSAASPWLADLLARVAAEGEAFLAPARKAAVRDMLRHRSYKPSGRSKPSSEYLLAAALEGSFPLVNGAVDANNAVSLAWGYPASIFDRAKAGEAYLLRRGGPGEAYVFNSSAQTIGLEDLIVLCRRVPDRAAGEGYGWEPCGNPVKDAMATKVFEDCSSIVAFVFQPLAEPRAELEACAERFVLLLREDCGAASAGFEIVG
jgi:DNA/RNA-binding domain of Phe-tRNA-synthetase-like protein